LVEVALAQQGSECDEHSSCAELGVQDVVLNVDVLVLEDILVGISLVDPVVLGDLVPENLCAETPLKCPGSYEKVHCHC
jgi:hypothetical protein